MILMENIVIKGARAHNLKNIDVTIPKNKLVVITGLSGSGKSSLAFDTIYAEGQRRYVESLSAYARQFLGMMEKADVDSIEGLSPAISIDQKTGGHNPRSTVGTVTEIYDYLRLLFARAGHPHSLKSGKRLESQTVQQIVDRIIDLPLRRELGELKIMILSPIIKNRKGTYEELFQRLLSQGYLRVRVDGEIFSLEEDIKLDRFKAHDIEIVVDRLVLNQDSKGNSELIKRLTDSVELALTQGNRELKALLVDQKEVLFFSEKLVDPDSGESFPEIEPHTFSFNSPFGACEKCSGLGQILEIDASSLYNPNLSISEGGIYPWSRVADNMDSWHMQVLKAVSEAEGFSLRIPIGQLDQRALDLVLWGSKGKTYKVNYISGNRNTNATMQMKFEGVIPNLNRRYKETESDFIRHEIERYMRELPCPLCLGKRLRPEALAVTILGKNINEVSMMSLSDLKNWVRGLILASNEEDALSEIEKQVVKQVIKEIDTRLDFLLAVGLNYLSLNRSATTLSGGESQRIRLASQIGSGLSGVLYVLDEPSIGLHQRDNSKLIETLQKLRDLDNTIIVVEHDQDTMLHADHLIDMGPGAGEHGGRIIAQGSVAEVIEDKNSITGAYLSGKKQIDVEQIKKETDQASKSILFRTISVNSKNNLGKYLVLKGARENNLKKVDLKIPLGKFVAITGVSGSGKSSLINETLSKVLNRYFYDTKAIPGAYDSIEGLENLDKVISIDQSPIGRTPRSNPATYTGIFTPIRELFSSTREARARGYKMGRFSFNVRGGRCEACQGDGVIKIEMQFLPDVYVTCDECHGLRYNRETLQIDYKGLNIAQILDLTVEKALDFFSNINNIRTKLETLKLVGLDYIKLGQPATTLSGGEAQRIKLATELSRRSTGRTIYILDEPTTGLHFEDLHKLLVVLHALVSKGNTVVVIEHNLDLIKTADWIIDLGPEGGDNGGRIIAEGTPLEVSNNPNSYTGEWLKKYL
ncbi:MAG TPA: excinuclease ABC subunit UvrA [Candidatus Dojkabacteria bacterium]|nr:excinuclease ABC subunit UvrA [Candidatus Dojkabacteria bacterium]